jgi:hypothetical protein
LTTLAPGQPEPWRAAPFTSDIVDACVPEGALRRHRLVISSDEGDLNAIAESISRRIDADSP